MQPAESAPPVAPVLPLSAALLKEEAVARFESRTARVGVVGLGYVGLPLALLFAEEGFRVTGVRYRQHQNRYACLLAVLHLPHSRYGNSSCRRSRISGNYRFQMRL